MRAAISRRLASCCRRCIKSGAAAQPIGIFADVGELPSREGRVAMPLGRYCCLACARCPILVA